MSLFVFQSVVRNGNVSIPPFDIRPSVLEIDRGQTGLMEIVFQPPSVKSYSTDMCMVCDNCHVKHFTVTGNLSCPGTVLIKLEFILSIAGAPIKMTNGSLKNSQLARRNLLHKVYQMLHFLQHSLSGQ